MRSKLDPIKIAGCMFLLSLGSPISAQDSVGDDSTVRYPAAYFEEWAPVTAQDMMDRIPGLSSGGGSRGGFSSGGRGRGGPGGSGGGGRGGRGFGSGSGGSEILINGKRTAGKNNSTGSQLGTITADQVNYFEIIRGTSGELDVRGSGQVVNVVLFEELSSATIQYEVSLQLTEDDTVSPGGNFSFSGQRGGLDYQVSARTNDVYFRSLSKENSILGDFSPNDLIREDRATDGNSTTISTNLGYDINSKSSARFNAQLGKGDGDTDLFRRTVDLKVSPNTLDRQRETSPSGTDDWEIGSDYEYNTDGGDRFKILFISNSATRENTLERFDQFEDGSESKILFLDTSSTTKERILRGSFTFDIFEGQNIELGGERAQTILDSSLALGLVSSTGIPSPTFGGLVPVLVGNANSSVEEIRYEPFAIHNWIINPSMTLETSLLYETSEITQSGDVTKKRDFDFVKPKVDFRYNLTPTIQLRGTIEKVVEQLSFNDFVAATDSQDIDSDVQVGNANLRQEWYWNYEINSDYRLPNDIGVLSARLYFEDWQDKIERLDVSTSEDNLLSANGNIGDGIKYGLELNSSVRMRIIDMPNLLVTASFSVEDSKITDPFLGTERRFLFSNRGRSSLGFRHDIPKWNLNYGVSWNNSFDGNRTRVDIDDIELSAGDPFWQSFVEWRGPFSMTYRLNASRLVNDAEFCRERQRFAGRVSSGILEEIEDQCSSSGREISLSVNGTF
ncbi:MAG: outer membrane receptor for ferrienterochelin and colicins [Pseudohongiellaceae bacterium]|jgi:outer membrane receptor for ferrienterochelin and colicins